MQPWIITVHNITTHNIKYYFLWSTFLFIIFFRSYIIDCWYIRQQAKIFLTDNTKPWNKSISVKSISAWRVAVLTLIYKKNITHPEFPTWIFAIILYYSEIFVDHTQSYRVLNIIYMSHLIKILEFMCFIIYTELLCHEYIIFNL